MDLNDKAVAKIDQAKSIGRGLCHIAREDGCHQSIRWDKPGPDSPGLAQPRAATTAPNRFTVKADVCVGCNMRGLICPVVGCITIESVPTGRPPMSWSEYRGKLAAGTVEPIEPPSHI